MVYKNITVWGFKEFIDYGLKHSDNIINGEPWSFNIQRFGVTREDKDCYIIDNAFFRNGDIIIFDDNFSTMVINSNGNCEFVKAKW